MAQAVPDSRDEILQPDRPRSNGLQKRLQTHSASPLCAMLRIGVCAARCRPPPLHDMVGEVSGGDRRQWLDNCPRGGNDRRYMAVALSFSTKATSLRAPR